MRQLTQSEQLIQAGKFRNSREYWKLRNAADSERAATRKMFDKLSEVDHFSAPAMVNGFEIQTTTLPEMMRAKGYNIYIL